VGPQPPSIRLFSKGGLRAALSFLDFGGSPPGAACFGRILRTVLFYGAVSAQTEKVVEFFLERVAAEAMIGEVREGEPELAVDLRVETIELG
jgi:hypothetical protein